MLQLLDLNKNKIAGLTEYKDLCIESVLKTGDKTLSFLYCKNSKHYFDIVEEAYIRTKENEFVVKEKNVQKDYTTFICKLNVEELEGHIFDRFESKEQTITDALNLAIVNTGWTVSKNTITKKRTIRKTNCSVWEIIQDIKKTYRVEIEFDTLNKQIKVYECLGSDKGTYFIDSLNLKTIDIQSNSYDFYTRIIPVGKDGITVEDINNGKKYVENYQYSKKIKTLIWKDERYTIKENLKDDAIAKLIDISKPYKAYKVEILNLAELNNEYKNVLDYHLGDTITLISKDNKIKEKQRIVKTKIYPEDHFKDSCELSNTVLSFEDIQKQFQEAAETIDNVTTDNGTIDGSSIDSVKTNQIEDFEANVIKVAKLKAVLAEIENLYANKADIQNLNSVIAKIGTLEATKASITQLDAINAVIQKVKAGKVDITDLNAAVAKISVLESKASTIDNLVSQKADIKDLNAFNTNISNALIKKANVAELEALETKTNKLIANKVDMSDLNATNANINSIKADTADIKTLINGNLSSENIQTGGITSDKLTISDGFIKDAMIANVSASKLSAGTIDAAKINVVNLNADNLTVGKINGHLLRDGSISGLSIGNGAIDNSKVAPGANIEASKININSVVTAINAGSILLTANKIAIDSDKGTLDLAFKNLNNSLENNKKATESNSTAINVVQGKINASIENSKILEGKQKTLEDNYNRTASTVDSLKNTIGSHKTLIDSATGKITSVEVKANTLEKDLNGLIQTVTDTKKVIENNKTSLESKNVELKANIDKVSSSLSSVSSTVDKNNKALVSKTNTLEQTLSGLTQTVSSNKATSDGKITSVENVTYELKAGLSGLTSKLDTLKSSTDGINKTVINQCSAINQLQDSIKLKVDSSTFNKSTETINSNINKAKEDVQAYADSKKNEAIKTAGLDATNKANNALNSAKAFVNAEITTVNSHLNKATAEINVLKEKIELKVGQSDIDKSIEDVKFGDRNLFPESYLGSHGCAMGKWNNPYMNIPTYNIVVNRPNQGNNFGFNIKKPIKINGGKGVTFTFLFNYIINKYINNHSSNMHGYTRVYYKDGSKQDFDFNSKIVNCNDKSNWGKWISLKFTFTTDINKEIDNIGMFYFYTDGASEGTDFNFTIPKLVIGNKIGDWTPAPEDTDQLIIDNIKTVTDKISTVESNLTQKTNSIEAGVRDLNSTTQTISTNISNINRDLTSKINSNLDAAKSFATDIATNKANTAKQEAISSANNIASSKAAEAFNNAKAYTNAEITTINSKVHNVESNLNILSDKINTKVSQSDIDKSISEINFNDINMILNSSKFIGTEHWSCTNGTDNLIVENNILKFKFKNYAPWGCYISNDSLLNKPLDVSKEYTVVCKLKASRNQNVGFNICDGNSYNYVYGRDLSITTEWQIFKFTFKPTQVGNERQFRFITSNLGYEFDLYIEFVKMVEGKITSDSWTISPEDVIDNIKITDSKISDVSSSVTQLRDSITTQINSINSKTHTIETTLGGKASKQEVTEVNNKVASIKASLNSITQRVSNSESKTHTLETSLNGKASKQEVTAVNSKVASIETNINGITQRVGNSESKINSLNGQVLNAATKHELTEFKQSTNDFKWKVEQGLGGNNLIKNSGFLNGYSQFFVTEYQWNGVNSSVNVWGDSSEWVMTGTNALVIRGTNGSHGAYGVRQENIKLKPNTTYTLSGYAAVHRGDWRISLAQNDWGWIASSRGNKSGGKNPDNWNRFEITFKTGPAHDYLTNCKLDLMLENAHNDAYAWFTNLVLNEGNIANKWQQFNNELYTSNMSFDSNGLYCSFSDGSHSSMGKDGFEWFNAGTGHSYHALAYVTSFGIPAGNPGRAYVKLPVEFTKRRKSLKWTVALRGYYYSTSGDFFPMHVHASGTEEYEENGILVCPIEGYCKIQNAQNSSDIQFRPLTAMLIAIA
ncbi:phage tail spike protein [Clostridium perfringens]